MNLPDLTNEIIPGNNVKLSKIQLRYKARQKEVSSMFDEIHEKLGASHLSKKQLVANFFKVENYGEARAINISAAQMKRTEKFYHYVMNDDKRLIHFLRHTDYYKDMKEQIAKHFQNEYNLSKTAANKKAVETLLNNPDTLLANAFIYKKGSDEFLTRSVNLTLKNIDPKDKNELKAKQIKNQLNKEINEAIKELKKFKRELAHTKKPSDITKLLSEYSKKSNVIAKQINNIFGTISKDHLENLPVLKHIEEKAKKAEQFYKKFKQSDTYKKYKKYSQQFKQGKKVYEKYKQFFKFLNFKPKEMIKAELVKIIKSEITKAITDTTKREVILFLVDVLAAMI